MEMKLELVFVPVSDVDRAIEFYRDRFGFNLDHDHRIGPELRFVQLTPPGSGCSIAIGTGLIEAPAGSSPGLQLVVADIETAKTELAGRGMTTGEVDHQAWGSFLYVTDPDGNRWNIQQLPSR
jgi:catechol 2,3-dioxygenase-like lactoylglutathione lyase family enzyme